MILSENRDAYSRIQGCGRQLVRVAGGLTEGAIKGRNMRTASGISIVGGIAVGRIRIIKAPEYRIDERLSDDPAAEAARFEEARVTAQERLRRLSQEAEPSVGAENASILTFQADILSDARLLHNTREMISKGRYRAEYAVRRAFANVEQHFREMDDPYMRERAADVRGIANAVIECLLGMEMDCLQDLAPAIIVAEDLTPAETVRLMRTRPLGIIMRGGSSNCHTAILARSMNLPTIVQCREIEEFRNGQLAVIDGEHACVYIEPTQDLLHAMLARSKELHARDARFSALRGQPNTTLDGTTVKVYVNISSPAEASTVMESDAEGVGLFRSEFLYLNRRNEPSEEEQFQAYRQVLRALAPRPVIIRTCDIGADKSQEYLHTVREENPALGYRGIRICLTRKEFFRKQLRALLRASAYGDLRIMFPMIISTSEVHACIDLLSDCRSELALEGQAMAENVPIGIMVETPAAVLCADELAAAVNFVSIGTNDLLQYTCAIDRSSAGLETYVDPHHPAVLREIQMTIEAAHRQGIPCGICGELGADLTLTETFLRMGVDELSVHASAVLPLRERIRSLDLR